jgi:putative ABC transport system permease protein
MMNIRTLVWAEIFHRKVNFALALAAVAVAVACSVGVVTLIRSHEISTTHRVAQLDDEIRKITKNMGFNIRILPAGLNIAEFYALDFGDKTMPIDYVQRLAESHYVKSLAHLRPALIRKMQWPEKDRDVLVMGVSGVVPFLHRAAKKPLSQPVPKGTMIVGHVLAEELRIKVGDSVTFHGRSMRIGKVYPQRGTLDDITVWIDLTTAQEILALPDQINMIQALECNCAATDRLAAIEREISELLGDKVQVIEESGKAIARAKARAGVKAAGAADVARLQRLASLLLPLVVVGAALLVGLLSLVNVRDRRLEIGILRAVGTRSSQVFALFILKALILGILGALIGYACGFTAAMWLDRAGVRDATATVTVAELFLPQLLTWVLLLTPLLAALASWLPAMLAIGEDPAVVLRDE